MWPSRMLVVTNLQGTPLGGGKGLFVLRKNRSADKNTVGTQGCD